MNTQQTNNTSHNDILYYDGQCPLCRKEIRLLTRIADAQLTLRDVHQLGLNPRRLSEMLKILHLQRDQETWLTGVDATIAAWSHTRWGWLFTPLNWPILRLLSHRAYEHWAQKRYDKRYRCQRCSDGV